MIRKGDKITYHRVIFPNGDRTRLRQGIAENDQFIVDDINLLKIEGERYPLVVRNIELDER